MSNITAIGMVETLGMLDAVKGLDTALKSANVTLSHLEKSGGGLVTFFVTGDVGAVKAAISSAVSEIQRNSNVISSHIIPRIASGTNILFEKNVKKQNISKTSSQLTTTSDKISTLSITSNTTIPLNEIDKTEKFVGKEMEEKVETKKIDTNENKTTNIKQNDISLVKRLEKMSLSKLKSMAHEECGLGKDEVKNMKKQKLIQKITKYYEDKK